MAALLVYNDFRLYGEFIYQANHDDRAIGWMLVNMIQKKENGMYLFKKIRGLLFGAKGFQLRKDTIYKKLIQIIREERPQAIVFPVGKRQTCERIYCFYFGGVEYLDYILTFLNHEIYYTAFKGKMRMLELSASGHQPLDLNNCEMFMDAVQERFPKYIRGKEKARPSRDSEGFYSEFNYLVLPGVPVTNNDALIQLKKVITEDPYPYLNQRLRRKK